MKDVRFRAWDKDRHKIIKVINLHWKYGSDIYDINHKYNRFVLMQYTGLKDAYSIEIYEGDIVKNYKRKEIVRWAKTGWYPFINKMSSQFCEVIGNIYESPEVMRIDL